MWRRQPLGQLGEPHQVGKQHRHLGVGIGNAFFARLQALRDRAGQDVEQQIFRFFLLLLELRVLGLELLAAQLFHVAQALFFDGRGQARFEQHLAKGFGQVIIGAHFNAAHHVVNVLAA